MNKNAQGLSNCVHEMRCSLNERFHSVETKLLVKVSFNTSGNSYFEHYTANALDSS